MYNCRHIVVTVESNKGLNVVPWGTLHLNICSLFRLTIAALYLTYTT